MRSALWRAVTMAALIGGFLVSMSAAQPLGTVGASGAVPTTPGCSSPHVLLLGSYPSEVSANLEAMVLDPDQPHVIDGLDFYAGTLDGQRVVTAIAGPAPSLTYATTLLALKDFSCTSAVVFSGTAGGGGVSQLGDVTVPSAWTSDGGAHFTPVSAAALEAARQIAGPAGPLLGTAAPVNDGPCLCQVDAEAIKVVPILRSPSVIVGGNGTTYGGNSDVCLAGGGMLEGCNPCPPTTGAAIASVSAPITLGGSSTNVARAASLAAPSGILVTGARALLAHASAPGPTSLAESANGPTYIADDQQTTGAQQAADADGIPFIAFRGISDTSAVGNLWPFEWLVFQQLAADNSATAARLWIQRWVADQ